MVSKHNGAREVKRTTWKLASGLRKIRCSHALLRIRRDVKATTRKNRNFSHGRHKRCTRETLQHAALKTEHISHRADRLDAYISRHVVRLAPQVQRRRRRRRLRPEPGRCGRRSRRKARETLVVDGPAFDLDTERLFRSISALNVLIRLFSCNLWGWYGCDRPSTCGKPPSVLPLMSSSALEPWRSCSTDSRALLLGAGADVDIAGVRHRYVALASS